MLGPVASAAPCGWLLVELAVIRPGDEAARWARLRVDWRVGELAKNRPRAAIATDPLAPPPRSPRWVLALSHQARPARADRPT